MTDKCILDGVEHEYHDGVVHTWGFKGNHVNDGYGPKEYICRRCNEIRMGAFPYKPTMSMYEHNATCDGTCDMCISRKILMNTGDANSSRNVSSKQWNSELTAYEQARAEGIQPAGTTMAAIQEARKASEAMGSAYSADTAGIDAGKITNKTVDKLKEVGLV